MDPFSEEIGKAVQRSVKNANSTTASPVSAVPPPSGEPARNLRGSRGQNGNNGDSASNKQATTPKSDAPAKKDSSGDATGYAIAGAVGVAAALGAGVFGFMSKGKKKGKKKNNKKGNGNDKKKNEKNNGATAAVQHQNNRNAEPLESTRREASEDGTSTPRDTEKFMQEADPQVRQYSVGSPEASVGEIDGSEASTVAASEQDAMSEGNDREVCSLERSCNLRDAGLDVPPMGCDVPDVINPSENAAPTMFEGENSYGSPLSNEEYQNNIDVTAQRDGVSSQAVASSTGEERNFQTYHEVPPSSTSNSAVGNSAIVNPVNLTGEKDTKEERNSDDRLFSEPENLKTVQTSNEDEAVIEQCAPINVPVLKNIKYHDPLTKRGNFSTVWEGSYNDIPVAIKIRTTEDSRDATGLHVAEEKRKDALKSILREAEIMAQSCEHTNIVNFLGVTGEENHPALVTQLCSLGPADELISETHEKSRRASLSLQTIVHIALQAAQGLHHLHNCGIIHHDVAARNVLLEDEKNWHVRITDFNLAQTVESNNDSNKTICPSAWLAPEAMREKVYDDRSDVFAFGVLLYELFSGKVPWEGIDNETIREKVLQRERLDIPEALPDALGQLINECWSDDPDDRPSMEKVVNTLSWFKLPVESQETTRRSLDYRPIM